VISGVAAIVAASGPHRRTLRVDDRQVTYQQRHSAVAASLPPAQSLAPALPCCDVALTCRVLTTSLLGNAARILAERPDLQEQLRRHPELVEKFVEEVLRREPPFRHHLRSARHDTTLGGVDIPADATVLLLWGAANRDPAEYERPDEVDLERLAPRHHLAFGRGIHHCVGAPLARIEARIVLTELLEHTNTITLDPNDPPRWVNSLMVRRHEHLPLRLAAR
jgi:cytochrome P450